MNDDNAKLAAILRTGESRANEPIEVRQKVYEELKRKLYQEYIFGREKELADALDI